MEDASDDEQDDGGGDEEVLHDDAIDMFRGGNCAIFVGDVNTTASEEFVQPPDKILRHMRLNITRERRKMRAKVRAAAKDGDVDVARAFMEAMELDVSTLDDANSSGGGNGGASANPRQQYVRSLAREIQRKESKVNEHQKNRHKRFLPNHNLPLLTRPEKKRKADSTSTTAAAIRRSNAADLREAINLPDPNVLHQCLEAAAKGDHWIHLHRLILGDMADEEFANKTEEEKAKIRRRIARENPAVVDEYFLQKIQKMFGHMFDEKALRPQNALLPCAFNACVKKKADSAGSTNEAGNDTELGSDEATHLCPTNEKVLARNHKVLKNIGNPIALIRAKSTKGGRSLSSDHFRGLEMELYLAVGSFVLLTMNLQTPVGLCNGATGTVVDIIWDDGVGPPALPAAIIVDFGTSYTGDPMFFGNGRRGWVPICPEKVWCDKTNQTREMVPLRLSSAWTPWKAQGETMHQQIVFDPGTREKTGMTYTALSRARSIRQIGIDGVNEARFTTQIANNAGLRRRVVEQKRLTLLAEATMQRWPLPPDDESVDGDDGGGGGGGGGGDGGRGNDDHPDEDMGESFDGTDQTIISGSEVADGSSDDESDDIESDDDDVVCLGNGEVAQPQQPPNEVVLVESASDNESDDSDDEPDTPPPRGRRIRGGTRMRLRRQRAAAARGIKSIPRSFLGHTLASRGLSV